MRNNIDRDIDNPDNYKFDIFYYNPKDKRIIVPKQNRLRGWTLNFGNLYSYLLLAIIISAILLSVYFEL